MNKKGNVQDLFTVMLVLVGLGIFSIVVLMTSHAVINRMENSTIGEDAIANQTMYEALDISESKTDYLILGGFVALILGIIITGYFATAHPVFMVFYVIALVILGLVSGMMQYLWEQMTATATFAPYVTYLPITNWILTNLVLVMIVMGFLGLIMLFIGYTVRPESA